MAPVVIDLTSSPEPEESPSKAAKSALQQFEPRSQRVSLTKTANQTQQSSSAPANGTSNRHNRNDAGNQLKEAALQAAKPPTQNGLLTSQSAAKHKPNSTLLASTLSRWLPSSGTGLSPPLNTALPVPDLQATRNVSSALQTQPYHGRRTAAQNNTNSAEVINVDGDADTSSSSSESGGNVGAKPQEQLHGARPLKKRRVEPVIPKNAVAEMRSNVHGVHATRSPRYTEPVRVRSRSTASSFAAVERRTYPTKSTETKAPSFQHYASAGQSLSARATPIVPLPTAGPAAADSPRNAPHGAESYQRQDQMSTSSSSGSSTHLPNATSQQMRLDSRAKDQRQQTVSGNSEPHDNDDSSGDSGSAPSFLDYARPRKRGRPYSQSEDETLLRLRDLAKMDWKDMLRYIPGRTIGSLSGHYSEIKGRTRGKPSTFSQPQKANPPTYSQAEDDLLIQLRDIDKMEWNDILLYFPDRTIGSITGHYGQLKVALAKDNTEVPEAAQQTSAFSNGNHGIPYSAEEDALLKRLKEVDKLNWDEISTHFSGRTRASLQVHYSSKLKTTSKNPPSVHTPKSVVVHDKSNTNHGVTYSAEEDARIVRLKSEGVNWDQMVAHFNGRTAGSLAVRYSSKLKDRSNRPIASDNKSRPLASADEDTGARPQRRRKHNGPSVLSGFISWADIKKSRQNILDEDEPEAEDEGAVVGDSTQNLWRTGARAHPRALPRILRQRELGIDGTRGWNITTRSITDEMKEHVFDDIGPRKFFQGTSGDVTCIAWAGDGKRFAAGSIAITDERSMQYNKPYNLLLGDVSERVLSELPEHHVRRPLTTDAANVNSLLSMRKTQDQRLFMTVAGVHFSPDGTTLYSAGSDCKVRAYSIDDNTGRGTCKQEIHHPAPIYLLSVSNDDVLATACHQATDDCIRVYRDRTQLASLSPKRNDSQTDRPIFPSALKWGTSSHHKNLLLAGFSIDSVDEERNMAGETCLWDVHHAARIEINAVTRNVFDVAWNPAPSTGSTAFAIASTPGVNKVNRGTKSVVQCFAPKQNRAAAVLEYESRAFDINDVMYCPHDNNLIAAGATDGKVYVWDQRFANKGSAPLHILAHGDSLNVLDHDRDREIADTGIRFLSWGATSSRLYSGSSDGVVKVWNPYRSSIDAHVKDIATFSSAVMSGAFSPDYRDLLIGEDQGRINLLSIGHGSHSIRSMERFELRSAPTSMTYASTSTDDGRDIARELVNTGQIELRPMGALPVRQAVQGKNYVGPYLAPSASDVTDAAEEYQTALNLQNEAHSEAPIDSQSSALNQSLRDADKRVQIAQEKMLQFQSRQDDAEALKPRANALQRGFKKAEKEHMELAESLTHQLERCKLDCSYFAAGLEEDAEVPDTQRSERRIPTSLWQVSKVDTSDMNVDELLAAGLTHMCITCFAPAAKPKSGLPLCMPCLRKRTGLSATCEICSVHVRPSLGKGGQNLCERCNFSCFRCGQPAFVADDNTMISCYACDMSWTMGALGYDVIETS